MHCHGFFKGLLFTTVWPEILAGNLFWRIGGLRAIRQYFIRQIAAQCDVIIIAKSYQCVYTRPAAS